MSLDRLRPFSQFSFIAHFPPATTSFPSLNTRSSIRSSHPTTNLPLVAFPPVRVEFEAQSDHSLIHSFLTFQLHRRASQLPPAHLAHKFQLRAIPAQTRPPSTLSFQLSSQLLLSRPSETHNYILLILHLAQSCCSLPPSHATCAGRLALLPVASSRPLPPQTGATHLATAF